MYFWNRNVCIHVHIKRVMLPEISYAVENHQEWLIYFKLLISFLKKRLNFYKTCENILGWSTLYLCWFICRLTDEGVTDFSKLALLGDDRIILIGGSSSIKELQHLKQLVKTAQSLTEDSYHANGWSWWSWVFFILKIGTCNKCLSISECKL